MNLRSRSIRSRIISLLVVPLVVLLVLWAFAVWAAAAPVRDLHRFTTYRTRAALPAESVVQALQQERRSTMVYLAGGRADPGPMADARRRSDQAVATFRRLSGGADLRAAAGALVRQRLGELDQALDTLAAGRSGVDRGALDRPTAMRAYTGIVDAAYRLMLPLVDLADTDLARQGRTLVALGRAREVLAQEDALLAGDAAAGRVSAADRQRLVQIIGTQRFLYTEAVAQLPRADHDAYLKVAASAAFARVRAAEEQVLGSTPTDARLPVATGEWDRAYAQTTDRLRALERQAAEATATRSAGTASRNLRRVVVAGLLGLLAIGACVLFSYRVGGALVRRLGALRDQATDLAERRLPEAVARLRRGERIEVDPAGPDPTPGADELDQLASAFAAVRHTALRSAAQEADTRAGLNRAFLNIARRSQTLLHRQLSLLDTMQRRASQPDDLEALFQVDHLATRMRRHAEDLVILAGAASNRGWRRPVPLVDVVRGAVGEVEQYPRVVVRPVPDLALAGPVVADLIHLLAELIENSASFSPPQTRIEVSTERVAHGVVLEVEDRGLGMSPEAIDQANRRLADPPEFDPSDSARLGLYVVSLLAARHGIGIRLRTSPYGGLAAVVLVPEGLVVEPGAEVGPGDRVAPVLAIGSAADARRARGVPRPRAAIDARPADRGAGAAEPAPPGHSDAAAGPGTGPGPDAAGDPAGPAAPHLAGAPAPGTAAPSASGPGPGAGPSAPASPRRDGRTAKASLPRRSRQASLAPQLRDPWPGPQDGTGPPPRSPEQVRAMMSAYQAGTARGRHAATEQEAAGAGPLGTPDGGWAVPAGSLSRPGGSAADADGEREER